MFNFTQQERQVVLFLLALALAGLGINFLAKRYAPVRALVCVAPQMGKVNLNDTDKQTLIGIPGIGEKLAQRIIEYRGQQGRFEEVEDLKKIKGITGYRYEKIKDLLYVN